MLYKHKGKIIGSPNWEVSVYSFIQIFWNTSFLFLSQEYVLCVQSFLSSLSDPFLWQSSCSKSTFHWFSNASFGEMEKCFLSLTKHKGRKPSFTKGCHTQFVRILSLACLGSDTSANHSYAAIVDALYNFNHTLTSHVRPSVTHLYGCPPKPLALKPHIGLPSHGINFLNSFRLWNLLVHYVPLNNLYLE